jgi:AmmeMemoRadiSam system protein B
MEKTLPRLRSDLDVMPSPSPEHPGLLLRDPYRYTDAMLVIPPVLVPALAYLDGEKTRLDLQAFLTRRVGQMVTSDVIEHLVGTLQSQGFLDTEEYYAMREKRQAEFRDLPERRAAHAGSAYPAHAEALREEFAGYFRSAPTQADPPGVIGIAAPHVSPIGGWRSYACAYAQLPPKPEDATYVLLGTSHYGQPEKFGLTRKPFVTPLGTLPVDTALVDWIEERAGDAVLMEDYCHSVEHSIEFQCVFLQHVLGANARILPILCGSFFESLLTGKAPESNPAVHRFFDTLGELAEREGSRLFWVLGVDLAHIGRRYGDRFAAQAESGRMTSVRQRDMERLEHYCRGDAEAFFELVRPNHDELRWCGYSALYTFLKAVPAARGDLLHYEQWNIDEQSVVSFAALQFTREEEQGTETQKH